MWGSWCLLGKFYLRLFQRKFFFQKCVLNFPALGAIKIVIKGKNFMTNRKLWPRKWETVMLFLQVWAISWTKPMPPLLPLSLLPKPPPPPLLGFPPLLPFDCLATTTFYVTLLHSTTTFSHISASTITFLSNSPGAAATPPFQLLCPLSTSTPPPFFFQLTPLSTSTITIYWFFLGGFC